MAEARGGGRAKAAAAGLTPTAGARATTIGMRTAERAERDWMTRCDAVESTTTTSMKGQGESILTALKAEVATHFARRWTPARPPWREWPP